MQFRSSIVTRADLDAIAADLGMETRDASRGGFVIRPGAGMDEDYRVIGSRGRRVFAVNWDGHYAFMAAAFDLDPNAVLRSALATWNGREDFDRRADYQPHNGRSPMNQGHAY